MITQMTLRGNKAQMTLRGNKAQMTQRGNKAQMTQRDNIVKKKQADNFPHKDITYLVIGVAMRIHRELGPGFLEAVYEEAMITELEDNNVHYQNQVPIDIYYKKRKLRKKYRADFVIDGKILIEMKHNKGLTKLDEMQMINYLKASCIKVGLLLNFGTGSLQWKRIIY